MGFWGIAGIALALFQARWIMSLVVCIRNTKKTRTESFAIFLKVLSSGVPIMRII